MAAPILRPVVAEQTAFNLGEFPGRIDQRGEEASRLKCLVNIVLVDRFTGEKFQRQIPFFTDDPSDIIPWVSAALNHERTKRDLQSFTEDREGGSL